MSKVCLGTIGLLIFSILLSVSCSHSTSVAEPDSVMPQKLLEIDAYSNQLEFENSYSIDSEVIDYCICGDDLYCISNTNDEVQLIECSSNSEEIIYQTDNSDLLALNTIDISPNYKCSVIQETINSNWEYEYNILFIQNDNQIISFNLNWKNVFKPVSFSITCSNKLVLYSSMGAAVVFDIVMNDSNICDVSYRHAIECDGAICCPYIRDKMYYVIVDDNGREILKEYYLNGIEKDSIDISSLCSGSESVFVYYNEEENILYFGTDSGVYTTDFSKIIYFSQNIPGVVDYIAAVVSNDKMHLKAYVNHFGYVGTSIIESAFVDYDEETQQIIHIGYVCNSPASNADMLSVLCERYHLSDPQTSFELVPIELGSTEGISNLISASNNLDIVFGSDYEIQTLTNYLELNNEWDYSSVPLIDDCYNNILETTYNKYNGYVISPFFRLSGMTIPHSIDVDAEFDMLNFVEEVNNLNVPLALSNTTDYIVLDWILNSVDSCGEIALSDEELKTCLDIVYENHSTSTTEQETAIHYCRVCGIGDYVKYSNWYSQSMKIVGSPSRSVNPYLVLDNCFSVCDCSDDIVYDFIAWLFSYDAQRIGSGYENISVLIDLSTKDASISDAPIIVTNETNGISMVPPICSSNTVEEVSSDYCLLISSVTEVYYNNYELRDLVYSVMVDYISGLSSEDATINAIRNTCYLYVNN